MATRGIILVVDDDEVARDLLVEALEKDGYHVESFDNGTDAIARGQRGGGFGADRYPNGQHRRVSRLARI